MATEKALHRSTSRSSDQADARPAELADASRSGDDLADGESDTRHGRRPDATEVEHSRRLISLSAALERGVAPARTNRSFRNVS